MATSGTTNFNLQVDDIIVKAYEKIGFQTIGADEARRGREALNLLFIEMTNRGAALSNTVKKTKPLTQDVNTLTFDPEDVDVMAMTIKEGVSEYQIERMPVLKFLNITNKNSKGRPTQYKIDRGREGIIATFWPVPHKSTYTAEYYVTTKIEDVSSLMQDVDLPTRYLNAVIFGLSWLLSLERPGVPPEKTQELGMAFESFLKTAMDEDSERVSVRLSPYPY